MLYGSLFSLKQFIAKLRPVDDPENNATQYYSFRTNNYKMHVRETAAGVVFLSGYRHASGFYRLPREQGSAPYDLYEVPGGGM